MTAANRKPTKEQLTGFIMNKKTSAHHDSLGQLLSLNVIKQNIQIWGTCVFEFSSLYLANMQREANKLLYRVFFLALPPSFPGAELLSAYNGT